MRTSSADRNDAAPAAGPAGARPPFGAVIFDMDGVVTDTATIHVAAWQRLFDEVLRDHGRSTADPPAAFDGDDYARYVDGRSREDGIRNFLEARGISVPPGTPDDTEEMFTVSGLSARKNALFLALLEDRGLRVFPGTEALLRRLRAGGVPVGLVTASRNAEALLGAARIRDLFDVIVDGSTALQLGLAGKPDPAMFLEAARRLNVTPSEAAVVEDALAGVQAAQRGQFGLVAGIARSGNRAALEAAGADLVVEDAGQLDLGSLRANPWVLTYEGSDPAHESHREALTTLANGYLGTRGAAPESHADGVHYPGTYLAGIYNRLTSIVDEREVEDEHLVNQPNWLMVDLRTARGAWWSHGGLECLDERRDLDMREGTLTRRVLLVDASNRRLRVLQRRLVSMARPHLAALQTTVVADNWEGQLTVRCGVDASVTNSNVAEYRALARQHLTHVTGEIVGGDILLVQAETSQSRIRVATASRSGLSDRTVAGRHVEPGPGHHVMEYTVRLRRGTPLVLEKVTAVTTSRDTAIASPAQGALDELARAPRCFEGLAREHQAAWSRIWEEVAIDIRGSTTQDRLVLNLHLFHLFQTLSPHTEALDAGVPARGLHGEGYRGHVFWDELFVLPVLGAHRPALARSLLDYRWRRLPAARDLASRAGLRGAMFPWQSGSDGREETPTELFNLRSQRWMPDNSRRQRHVGLAVAFNAWQYYTATGDLDWLTRHGAELVVEVTRLFAAMSSYDPDADRFHIDGVMGPDEYHDGYPGAAGTGVRDNAYTNVMAAWVCAMACEVLRALRPADRACLTARIGLDADEPAQWQHLSRRLFVPFHEGVISQFDGYEALTELDWERYRSAYGNIGRLDLILEAEGDSTNRYKLAKQADVLMLLYLLGPDQLLDVLERLGYPTDGRTLSHTVDYYLARTAHGSTLSRVVHASVLARLDPKRAWSLFRDALVADLDDTQGGTTGEGVHLGAMAGTVDILMRSFANMRIGAEELLFAPHLPDEVKRLGFRVRCCGQVADIAIDRSRRSQLRVNVAGNQKTLNGDHECVFAIPNGSTAPPTPTR